MPHFDALADEVNILYAASNRLTRASTPAEWLEAVSGYARDQGATVGVLFYLEGDVSGQPEYGEIVATWTTGAGRGAEVGARFAVSEHASFVDLWLVGPDRPLFIPDALADDLLDEATLALYSRYDMRSAVVLPLNNKGRWVGILMFTWNEPRHFDERDQRIFTAMIQQATPIIDSMRLFDQSRERAARAEHLLKVNLALSRATDETHILDALALYAVTQDAVAISMDYLDYDESDAPMYPSISWTVALWKEGKSYANHRSIMTLYQTHEFGINDLVRHHPDEVLFVESIADESRLSLKHRQFVLANLISRALAVMPLFSSGRFQGGITIMWNKPHIFSDEEQYIYTALLQTLSSTVASRRAYLAEEAARQESELLYRASKGTNIAATVTEIVEAVERLDFNGLRTVLGVYEHYDFENAAFLEVTSKPDADQPPRTRRVPIKDMPIVGVMSRTALYTVEDTANRDQIDAVTAATIEAQNARSLISVPLAIDNSWMGNLVFRSDEPRTYTDLERRMAAGIGDLVAAALERIRLRAKTESSRIRAELLAQVNAALSQSTDEQAILSAVSLLAERYGVSLSTLAYLNIDAGGGLQAINIVALRSGDGRSPLPLNFLPVSYFKTDDYPILQVAYANPDQPTFIENALADPRTEAGNTRRFSEALDWNAVILVPLKAGDQWQGLLTFIWNTPQAFDDDLHRLFTAIQAPATSVVASRRAYLAAEEARRETEARAHELETVAKVSAVAASVLNKDELLDTVSYLTRISFSQYQILIYLLDEKAENLVQATRPLDSPDEPEHRILIHSHRSLVARAAQTRRGIIVNDITNTPDFSLAPFLAEARSEMAAPMVVADRLIGVLDIQSLKVDRFAEDDIRVMSTLADLIAVAVENARLYEQAQEIAAFEERNRLARELHDSVSQALYGIALGTRTARILLDRDPTRLAEPLEYVMSLAQAGLTEMRALIFELRPESLENEGLVIALTKQAESVQARHGVAVTTDLGTEPPFSIDIKEALYRIAREALHNIVKHANASHVVLNMRRDATMIHLDVRDDGKGFDPHGDYPGHLGLHSMRERVERLGGALTIDSAPGDGTRIAVHIPLQSSAS